MMTLVVVLAVLAAAIGGIVYTPITAAWRNALGKSDGETQQALGTVTNPYPAPPEGYKWKVDEKWPGQSTHKFEVTLRGKNDSYSEAEFVNDRNTDQMLIRIMNTLIERHKRARQGALNANVRDKMIKELNGE